MYKRSRCKPSFDTIHRCDCVAGYTGPSCETDINECADNPCQNGGVCSNLLADYSCKCTDGFSGKNCEKGMTSTY